MDASGPSQPITLRASTGPGHSLGGRGPSASWTRVLSFGNARWPSRPRSGPPVTLTATIYTFDIQLADVDRGVYETIALRVARHPSETAEYLLTRVLAYCLEFGEGLGFSRGLADPDEPALAVRDLTGALRAWIDVGSPDAARLHRASKAARRVVVYTHKDPGQLLRQLAGERIHRAEALEFYGVDRQLLAELVARLERRMAFSLSVTDRHLYLTIGGETLSGVVEPHTLAPR